MSEGMQRTKLYSTVGESEGIPIEELLKHLPQNPFHIFSGHSKWGRMDVAELKKDAELAKYNGEEDMVSDNQQKIQDLIDKARGVTKMVRKGPDAVFISEDGLLHTPRPPAKTRPQPSLRTQGLTGDRQLPILATSNAQNLKLQRKMSMTRESFDPSAFDDTPQGARLTSNVSRRPSVMVDAMYSDMHYEADGGPAMARRGSGGSLVRDSTMSAALGSKTAREPVRSNFSQRESGVGNIKQSMMSDSVYATDDPTASAAIAKMKELEGKTTLEKFIMAPKQYGTAEKVKTKLKTLKDQTDEYEEFQRRIRMYHIDKRKEMLNLARGRDLVKENKLEVFILAQPDVNRAMKQARLRRHQEHIFEVQDQYLSRREASLHQKYMLTMRKDMREKMELESVNEERNRELRRAMGAKWIVYAMNAARASLWFYALKEHKGSFKSLSGVRMMVLMLQANFRRHQAQKLLMKRRAAREVICSVIYRYYRRLQQSRREWAARITAMFLQGVNDSKRIVLLMKQYRFKIIRLQRAWREYRHLMSERLHVLCVQWDRLLPHYVTKRFGPDSNKSALGTKKSPKHQIEAESAVVRNPTLSKTLYARRRAYLQSVKEWEAACVTWKAEEDGRQQIESARRLLRENDEDIDPTMPRGVIPAHIVEPPVKPKFRLLLAPQEMLQLIDRSINAYELSLRRER